MWNTLAPGHSNNQPSCPSSASSAWIRPPSASLSVTPGLGLVHDPTDDRVADNPVHVAAQLAALLLAGSGFGGAVGGSPRRSAGDGGHALGLEPRRDPRAVPVSGTGGSGVRWRWLQEDP